MNIWSVCSTKELAVDTSDPKQMSEELIASTHVFPSHFTFKAVGPADEVFLQDVLAAAHSAVKDPGHVQHRVRHSENGRHASITLDVLMENAKEVMVLY